MDVAPGIYSLGNRQGGHVHAYLLDDGQGITIIDTLMAADAGLILAELTRIGRTPADIKHLIMTHAHRSHLGGLARLKELSGAPVYAHEWEADIISADRVAQPVSSRPWRPVRTWPLQLALNLNLSKHPPTRVDEYVHEGDRMSPLTVIFAPVTRLDIWLSIGRNAASCSPATPYAPGPCSCSAGAASCSMSGSTRRRCGGWLSWIVKLSAAAMATR